VRTPPARLLAGGHREVRSAGTGARGQRWYGWSWLATASPQHYLLIRRHLRTGELAFHYCFVPEGQPVTLTRLIRAAGLRWPVEDGFAAGKELAGLDEHQVRSWTSWHRWTILALLAHAFLSVLTAAQPRGDPHDDQLIPLTRNEICKLLTGLSRKLAAPAMQLHWSRWRRRHQATARACHYRRRALAPT
jgi:hypothetical protein